jgi:hypothetical protein
LTASSIDCSKLHSIRTDGPNQASSKVFESKRAIERPEGESGHSRFLGAGKWVAPSARFRALALSASGLERVVNDRAAASEEKRNDLSEEIGHFSLNTTRKFGLR